jgi:hypothetical protein
MLTFCEQYAVKPTDSLVQTSYPKGSKFGDLYFLDVVKGSALSGKSKVKTNGSDPFFGHARMINEQCKWHPIKWVKQRAVRHLWAANYNAATRLSSNMASLPRSLGGVDLALGRVVKEDDPLWIKRRPYYLGILKLKERKDFLVYNTLLSGIYYSDSKGMGYDNLPEKIYDVIYGLDMKTLSQVEEKLPDYVRNFTIQHKLRYINRNHGYENIRRITDVISRKQAFTDFWNLKEPKTFMTLPNKSIKQRASAVWSYIYLNIEPAVEVDVLTIKQMASHFDDRSWDLYFDKNCQSIKDAYDGMPSLHSDFSLN